MNVPRRTRKDRLNCYESGMTHEFRAGEGRYDGGFVVVGLFWIALYGIITTVDHLVASTAILFLPRFLICLSGLLVSTALITLRTSLTPSPHLWRIAMMVACAILGAGLQVAANYAIFRETAPEMRPVISAIIYLADVVHWFWIYAAELGIVFAFDYSREVAERERRIATLDRAAHQAQLRALRYQLNPHFIFNTLNSIAALVGRKDSEPAERMIEDLSDFLRATLEIDPNADVPLSQELELQSRYLGIETRRFPSRLKVEMRIEPDVTRALVPSLITQPLTENVIRHAVAISHETITLSVTARRVGDELEIRVVNTAVLGAPRANGTGVGLVNVAERLLARYGSRHSFTAQAEADGRFAAAILLPYSVSR
jgi:two-component system LytT family sensor kinase